ARPGPDALGIASTLSIAWLNSASKPPWTKSPVLGSRPICAVTWTSPSWRRACTYGPRGSGAPLIVIVSSCPAWCWPIGISSVLRLRDRRPQRLARARGGILMTPVDVDDHVGRAGRRERAEPVRELVCPAVSAADPQHGAIRKR